MWLLGRLPVRRKHQILGLCLLSVALFLGLALATRDPRDVVSEVMGTGAVRNQGGVLGAVTAAGLVRFLGPLAAWLPPALLLVWGLNRVRLKPVAGPGLWSGLGAGAATLALGFLYLVTGGSRPVAGALGEWVGQLAARLLGRIGAELALGTALAILGIVAFEVTSPRSPLRLAVASVLARVLPPRHPARAKRGAEGERSGEAVAEEALLLSKPRPKKSPAEEEEEMVRAFGPAEEKPKPESRPRIIGRREAESRAEPLSIPFPPPAPKTESGAERAARAERRAAAGGTLAGAGDAAGPGAGGALEVPLALGPASAAPAALPSLDLLDAHEARQEPIPESELLDLSRVLERTLADFGVEGKVSEVHPGPVITLFEYEPAPGVKVNQILQRQDDLALALRAQRIRIVAPIPGKAAVGIEIPNRVKAMVSLREIIAAPQFRDMREALPFALGKDVAGVPFTASLERMPHLLIAGATGSGKSVCINVLIMSLLYRRTAAELRFIMIDPKMLELTPYNGIPHLRMPVVTDPKKAAQALRFCVREMERRYQILAKHGARNIDAYNRLQLDPATHEEPRLPYLVVVVDELADLMALLPTEIEEPVGRLAQMARAVGIHIILATQRPSVDVITGVIKANFPSRIAFQVASRTDSRVILDMNGAESLLGYGDSLYLPSGKPEPHRIHCSYVSGEEIERVVNFLKSQAGPRVVPDDSVLEQAVVAEYDADDVLYEEAMRLVVLHQQASTSMLQRRLKVGYSRAARLLDLLEERGVVGPSEGAKGREVLITEDDLDDRLTGRAPGIEAGL
jgi:DNA segregation ATPase FtsK/SpoIIIE-like protein